jgi:hypothetical protein
LADGANLGLVVHDTQWNIGLEVILILNLVICFVMAMILEQPRRLVIQQQDSMSLPLFSASRVSMKGAFADGGFHPWFMHEGKL